MCGDSPQLSAMDEAAALGAMEPCAGLRRALMARDDGQSGTHITDLPAVVLGSILAHLADPVDVMSTLFTCRLFWFLVRTAPFRLRLRPRQFDETPAANCDDAPPKRYTSSHCPICLNALNSHQVLASATSVIGCFESCTNTNSVL